ncbi:MAG TPA: DNA (cytosine-5-)-methyltransferase [Verrucomicrobiae bacterium]|jgi:DNA (cytosine-5)-methyltransferase 1|nr:DNA (cytosine-5-)-methyltransferase [Verrucomicrobiae bacterium]
MIPATLHGVELRIIRQRLGLSQAKLAEITGVPQADLSAFELGKLLLDNPEIDRVNNVLANTNAVQLIAGRKKRYRQHQYGPSFRDPTRISMMRRTGENEKYIKLLLLLDKQRNRTANNPPLALSLFSGCGGFSTGFSWAGFKIQGFLEINPEFRKIYQNNFPNAKELGTDITKVTENEIRGWKQKNESVDVIIGGPPCQGFSLSGKRKTDDSRNTLFEHYLRVVAEIRPKVAVLENVRLLASMRFPDGSFVGESIYEGFQRLGYLVKAFEVNARDYGVPQHRERILFVAVRKDQRLAPSIPHPMHCHEKDLFLGKLPYRSFADACSDLEFLESGEKSDVDPLHEAVSHPKHVIDWLWNVPQGASAHDNENPTMRPPSGYNTTYKRQVWLEPASTIQTTFGMISGCRNVHPIATRALTIREAARIQSFPDTYKFSGSLGTIRTSIGNAVPPLLAYYIGCHLKQNLN